MALAMENTLSVPEKEHLQLIAEALARNAALETDEALLGAPFQAEQYAGQCSTMDTARYDEGFRVAYARRPLPTW